MNLVKLGLTKRDEISMSEIFKEYGKFSEHSGLFLNVTKTEILCFNNRRETALNFQVNYLSNVHNLTGMDQVKVNGILFRQDPRQREEVNVAKSTTSMERLLRWWSTRRLTLLGKILILKTFAFSQLIYLMQSISLGEASRKAALKVIYKYLWNKNFDATKAPERIKRSIMLTPVQLGGFGLLDLKDLGDSLDLRSYGRLQTTMHPFLRQLTALIITDDFFNVRIDALVDNKLKRSIEIVNDARRAMMTWPIEDLLTNTNFVSMLSNTKLTDLLTPQGKQSVAYFMIHRRVRQARVKQVTVGEFGNIKRFIKYRNLEPIIEGLVLAGANQVHTGNMPINEMYPLLSSRSLVKISSLSSRSLRLSRLNKEESIICIYKQGLILNPGEVLNWTKSIKRLTSTRHKNIILRIAHGDIYSNERLCRFGLLEDPKCNNCHEPIEDINHRIIGCPKALLAWNYLNELKLRTGIKPLTDLSMDNLLGAKDRLSKIELALNAELLHRLCALGGKEYCPKLMVRSAVKLIKCCEPLPPELLESF